MSIFIRQYKFNEIKHSMIALMKQVTNMHQGADYSFRYHNFIICFL